MDPIPAEKSLPSWSFAIAVRGRLSLARRQTCRTLRDCFAFLRPPPPPPSLFRCIQFRLWFEPLVCRVIPSILSRSFIKGLVCYRERKKEKRTNSSTDASHYASYVTTINGRIIRWYVPSGWNNILFVFIWQNNVRPRCRDLFDMFNTCQPIIDREKNVRLFVPQFSKINPRRNHDFDSYENTIYAFADQAFNKQCLRLPWNSAVEFYFLSPSLSQFVISSSQSKGDGRFFSLEIFLPVAINVANRNRATFHILISAKLMFRFHVLY